MYIERLNEGVEIHNKLNPKIWTKENELRPEVKKKLNEIAKQFISELKDKKIPFNIIDIRIVGSNASYNYTDESDIDLHIVTTLSSQTNYNISVMQLLYNYFRSNFNQKYDISIHGVNVELYIEDEESTVFSNGIYSLLQNEWLKFPDRIEEEDIDISDELKPYKKRYKAVVKSQDPDEANELFNEICLLRKDGIAKDGELSVGNLIFKEFRNKGYIGDLKDIINQGVSKELSMESLQRRDYYPRYERRRMGESRDYRYSRSQKRYILNEDYNECLYHATTIQNLNSILKSNCLDINKARRYGKNILSHHGKATLSFTTSYDFAKNKVNGTECIITFDKNKLCRDFDMREESDYADFIRGTRNMNVELKKDEYTTEESITNVRDYILKIDIKSKSYYDYIDNPYNLPIYYGEERLNERYVKEGYGYKWKPSKTAKREFAQTMSDIDQFCYDNAIVQSKNSDSYYFTIDGQKYRVSNHTIEASNRGAYNDFGERVRPNYHDEKEKEEEIQITAGKTRIKQIYNDLKAGYKLDKRGNRM